MSELSGIRTIFLSEAGARVYSDEERCHEQRPEGIVEHRSKYAQGSRAGPKDVRGRACRLNGSTNKNKDHGAGGALAQLTPPPLTPPQVEIAPPLLGKFQTLVLDNRDLAGLARCLPPDSGSRSPNGGGSGNQSPVGGAASGGGGGGDGRDAVGDAQQQPQQRERPRPDLLPLNVADMNSGYAGRVGSAGGGGGADVGEHTQPLDSPSNTSLFSFGSSTSMAEEDEVNRK